MGSLVGIDEVGRGCLAGPLLVVAARASSNLPRGLRDSKLLSRKQRIELLSMLSSCCEFGEGWVECHEINKIGLAAAIKLGVQRALVKLNVASGEEILMDGNVNYIPKKFNLGKVMINADSKVPIVSAASIYAKVKRDEYMAAKLAKQYPRYYFEKHVGYGTRTHLQALETFGIIRNVHRETFAPIAKLTSLN